MSSVRLSALYVMLRLEAGEPTRVLAGRLKPVIRALLRDMRKRLKTLKLERDEKHAVREAISILSNNPTVEDTVALCLMWNTVTEELDPSIKFFFMQPTKTSPEAE